MPSSEDRKFSLRVRSVMSEGGLGLRWVEALPRGTGRVERVGRLTGRSTKRVPWARGRLGPSRGLAVVGCEARVGSGRIARRWIDEVVFRRDHEPEIPLRGCSGRRERGRKRGKVEMGENGSDDLGVGDEGDHATTTRAAIAVQDIDLVDSAEELSPGEVTRSPGHGRQPAPSASSTTSSPAPSGGVLGGPEAPASAAWPAVSGGGGHGATVMRRTAARWARREGPCRVRARRERALGAKTPW